MTGKCTIAKTLLKYEIEIDRSKTPDKLTYNPEGLFMTTEGTDDIYMKFKTINSNKKWVSTTNCNNDFSFVTKRDFLSFTLFVWLPQKT